MESKNETREPWLPGFLYQLCVILNCFLDPLWLDADVSLRGGGGTVL
jgi:hypothetical protein